MIPQSKASILVIEDNPADVQLFRLALNEVELECDLTVIRDGGDALAWVHSNGANGAASPPDLVVVDLNLPKYDGIEILEAICADKQLAGVPALVLSSSPSPRDVARVNTFPNTRYLTKPSQLEEYVELGQVVRDMLDRRCPGAAKPGPE